MQQLEGSVLFIVLYRYNYIVDVIRCQDLDILDFCDFNLMCF